MLANMKDQIKEKQTQSDHDWEQASLTRENDAHEQEALKHDNDQLMAQITTLYSLEADITRKQAQRALNRWAHHKFEVAQINVPL